ncbi:MAG: MotA/TolQ/ExbB proton channel family protein [Patescibacteria group bacterium]
MKEKRIFLQWAVMASLIVIGAVFAYRLGMLHRLKADPSHLPYVTLVAFTLATAWCGRLCWRLSKGTDPKDVKIGLILSHYASSLCVSIGLIGTVVGYIIMFLHGSEGNEEAKAVIKQVFGEANVALMNTALGGICGVLVEIQSQYIKYDVALIQRRAKRQKKLREADARPAAPEQAGAP